MEKDKLSLREKIQISLMVLVILGVVIYSGIKKEFNANKLYEETIKIESDILIHPEIKYLNSKKQDEDVISTKQELINTMELILIKLDIMTNKIKLNYRKEAYDILGEIYTLQMLLESKDPKYHMLYNNFNILDLVFVKTIKNKQLLDIIESIQLSIGEQIQNLQMEEFKNVE